MVVYCRGRLCDQALLSLRRLFQNATLLVIAVCICKRKTVHTFALYTLLWGNLGNCLLGHREDKDVLSHLLFFLR